MAPIDIFFVIDDFCKYLQSTNDQNLLLSGTNKRNKPFKMWLSEIMTIEILFHLSHYKDFKAFYLQHVCVYLRSEFPNLVSYNRFVELKRMAIIPLFLFMKGVNKTQTGIYFVDSTTLKVCHIKREKSNKTFKGIATKSKSTMGWFFGFKVHIIINNLGEIMNFTITAANVDDRKPVPNLMQRLKGWLFGDKGYLGKPLAETLKQQAISMFTKVKKNMQKQPITPEQTALLKKRGIVETVIGQLKNICQVEHTRHRAPINALVNIVAAIVAYTLKPRKPSIKVKISPQPLKLNPNHTILISN